MTPLPPGSTIGILGGGQLGRMLAIAAAEMGYHVHIYCPEDDCPAAEVAKSCTVAAYEDKEALAAFAKSVDVITYEFENIPHACVATLAGLKPVYPSPDALAICQHRVQEKQFVQSLGIATAPFKSVHTRDDLNGITFPAVLKTCRMGYDGKGQWMLKSEADIPKLPDAELILEGFVGFTMEISVIVARNAEGQMASYVPVQNVHKHHILHQTIAPAPIDAALGREAEAMAKKIAEGLKLVGILAVEMFVGKDGRLLVNELAPRPHNSGHWTLDACPVSQFEQTIRAVCGLKLGNPERLCDAVMTNLIGEDVNKWLEYIEEDNTRLHLYGKKEAKPGRKMGHVTKLLIS